jgi:3-O-methylgallate 3,4-dioxygenase
VSKIVAGFGTSHGPQLKAAPPEAWEIRGVADRRNKKLEFRGKSYTYDELRAEREDFSHEITHDVMQRRWDSVQASMDKLSAFIKQADVDALVIVSSDHKEVYGDELLPVFAIYWGDSVDHVPFTAEQLSAMASGLAEAAAGDVPDHTIVRPTHRQLARHLIEQTMEHGFDISASEKLPAGSYDNYSIPHGHGFIYQRFMGEDSTVPFVPVFVNTFYEPNPPSAKRSFEFGRALGRAIESFPGDLRIGVVASGGLSHFVVDEKLDREFLDALKSGDEEYLASVPASEMRSGASELRNWIAVAGIADVAGLEVSSIDYEPCYRTEAGTGNAMGFVTWGETGQA